jgi:hypothetical protein
MTRERTLPNHWNLFHLSESPYFQDTLGEAGARYPLSLFVGRTMETQRLLAGIGGSSSSRQAIGGAPGIGKTTLVQFVKAAAVESGYWATHEVLPFYPDDTTQRVMGGVLGGIYDAIVTARPQTADRPAMQSAQQYVRAFRLTGGGANVSVFGVGAGGSRSSSAVTPSGGLLLDGPRLVRELLDLALEGNGKGIVLHLNNLENLSERDVNNAADILRSLRDTVLLQPGLHTLLVGTSEAVSAATTSHPQLRSVFTLTVLEPFPLSDVQDLLAARYRHLRLPASKRATPPVAPEAVASLYPMFRGDLRGLFKALEEGVNLLVGISGSRPGASLTMDELAVALQRRYQALLAASLSTTRLEQLHAWATKLGVEADPTQDDLKRAWKVSQPGVSQALKDLVQAGCVSTLPRQAPGPTRYSLAGPSRLAFGKATLDRG